MIFTLNHANSFFFRSSEEWSQHLSPSLLKNTSQNIESFLIFLSFSYGPQRKKYSNSSPFISLRCARSTLMSLSTEYSIWLLRPLDSQQWKIPCSSLAHFRKETFSRRSFLATSDSSEQACFMLQQAVSLVSH